MNQLIKVKKLQKKDQDQLMKDLQNMFGDWLDSLKMSSNIKVVKSSTFYNYIKDQIEKKFSIESTNPKDIQDFVNGQWAEWKPFARKTWLINERLGRVIRREKTQLYDIV